MSRWGNSPMNGATYERSFTMNRAFRKRNLNLVGLASVFIRGKAGAVRLPWTTVGRVCVPRNKGTSGSTSR